MNNELVPFKNELLIYTTPTSTVRVEVMYSDETFWLTQKQIAELFGADIRTISEHLKKIFSSGELAPDAVIRKFRITAADGKNYLI